MKKTLSCMVALAAAVCGAVELRWEHSPATNAVYKLHVWQSGVSAKVFDLPRTNQVSISPTNLPFGKISFTMTAVLPDGTESVPSNEVLWTNRFFAPVVIIEGASTLPTTNWQEIARAQLPAFEIPGGNVFIRYKAAPLVIVGE